MTIPRLHWTEIQGVAFQLPNSSSGNARRVVLSLNEEIENNQDIPISDRKYAIAFSTSILDLENRSFWQRIWDKITNAQWIKLENEEGSSYFRVNKTSFEKRFGTPAALLPHNEEGAITSETLAKCLEQFYEESEQFLNSLKEIAEQTQDSGKISKKIIRAIQELKSHKYTDPSLHVHIDELIETASKKNKVLLVNKIKAIFEIFNSELEELPSEMEVTDDEEEIQFRGYGIDEKTFLNNRDYVLSDPPDYADKQYEALPEFLKNDPRVKILKVQPDEKYSDRILTKGLDELERKLEARFFIVLCNTEDTYSKSPFRLIFNQIVYDSQRQIEVIDGVNHHSDKIIEHVQPKCCTGRLEKKKLFFGHFEDGFVEGRTGMYESLDELLDAISLEQKEESAKNSVIVQRPATWHFRDFEENS